MSVNDLINLRQQQDEKTEAITVRLSSYYVGIIDDLSASLDVTRQRLLTEIIKDGVDGALALFNQTQNKPDIETEVAVNGPNFYILNTNITNNIESHKDMLERGVAAAFCDPWKFNIERLKKGDVVFLYESGTGIVATGKASGKVEKLDYEGVEDDGYQQKLNEFKKVKPLSAKEIKKVTNASLVFLKTMFKISAVLGSKIQDNLEIM